MASLPRDYDSDPGRFLANTAWPHDDVHPFVAARFTEAGARTVLDVGGGNGKLARLLPGAGMRCALIDLSPTMLALAPRPAVRADGSRLPFADESVDAVAALFTLYHYGDPREPIAEARRVLRPGGLFAACSAARDSHPELAGMLPGWGRRSTYDAEDAPGIVSSVFRKQGDVVEVRPWEGPYAVLSSVDEAAGFIRVHAIGEDKARDLAATLELPLTLTMRGSIVYASKAT